ncbi:MAG TPA: hypothetical protein VHU15_05295 [Stellaceae bacterium]|jgi:hypothetical protein|nr:hypothetical protein [Stellaceae bacterium]
MQDAPYYRGQADKARRLARATHDTTVGAQLWLMASDYDDIADDLETGAVEIRHPELLGRRQG